VHAHGGTLEVERQDTGRFKFHLELPVAAIGAGTEAAS